MFILNIIIFKAIKPFKLKDNNNKNKLYWFKFLFLNFAGIFKNILHP